MTQHPWNCEIFCQNCTIFSFSNKRKIVKTTTCCSSFLCYFFCTFSKTKRTSMLLFPILILSFRWILCMQEKKVFFKSSSFFCSFIWFVLVLVVSSAFFTTVKNKFMWKRCKILKICNPWKVIDLIFVNCTDELSINNSQLNNFYIAKNLLSVHPFVNLKSLSQYSFCMKY